MTEPYRPYPEFELEALASEYDKAAASFGPTSKFRDFYSKRAAMLRNANVCHEALRERCLTAELERDARRSSAA